MQCRPPLGTSRVTLLEYNLLGRIFYRASSVGPLAASRAGLHRQFSLAKRDTKKSILYWIQFSSSSKLCELGLKKCHFFRKFSEQKARVGKVKNDWDLKRFEERLFENIFKYWSAPNSPLVDRAAPNRSLSNRPSSVEVLKIQLERGVL